MEIKYNPVLSLKQGRLRGVIENNVCDSSEFLAFRGIPYAKPPIGELRFKDPLPAEGWTDIRDASQFGHVCFQRELFTLGIMGQDDCLYLNVYTKKIEEDKKKPVMVWIHGGGFFSGSGNDQLHAPDYLVRKDIVLVTFNYRVGVLGFLNLEDEAAPGNQGLKDQVMALRWVRDNISVFGGDPENVTIFGGSAGGASVHYLTMSPMADGLFHKAIAQSGSATNPWAYLIDEPKRYGYQLAAKLGFKSFNPKEVVDFLRKVDGKKLVEQQARLKTPEEDLSMISVFGPGIDNKSQNPFLSQSPTIAMQYGSKVPFLVGFNEMEGSIFVDTSTIQSKSMSNEVMYEIINHHFESILPVSILKELKEKGISTTEFKRFYFGYKLCNGQTMEEYAYLMGDTFFYHGIFKMIDALIAANKFPVYMYKFCFTDDYNVFRTFMNIKVPGTTHAEELLYLFYGRIQKLLGISIHEEGTTQSKVMEYFTQMWTDFAKTGNPTPAKTELIDTLWEPLEKDSDCYKYMRIDKELKMENLKKGEQRHEWNFHKKNKL